MFNLRYAIQNRLATPVLKRWSRILLLTVAFHLPLAPVLAQEQITIQAQANATPFPHFWETIFGSGRAVLSLRESYRKDMRQVKNATAMAYVRPHAIFHDEIGVYDEDAQGQAVYNFTLVDQIYDGLLENGVRPFVELSFMPRKLALHQTEHPFWFKQITSPPKDWQKWEDLIEAFSRHLIARYGEAEVAQWYFEVWNEPNIDFWSGDPKEASFYELYGRTAKALKRVSPRLRVGGPGTAQAAWVDRFIAHCVANKLPVDFVTTHVYGNESAQDVFGTQEAIPRKNMVGRSVQKVYDQVKRSALPDLPIIWSEYNATYRNDVAVTDSAFMGPWLANNIRLSSGKVDAMSFWTFSDVFEEFGIAKTPFYGGFGLIATGHIPKPSFNAFSLLHKLGNQRLAVASEDVLVTRRDDGSLAIAAWNYAEPGSPTPPLKLSLRLEQLKGLKTALVHYLDPDHGSALALWESMGKPTNPSREQLLQLRQAALLPEPRIQSLKPGSDTLSLEIPAYGLVLVELIK